jgi:diacylglycerol O-acyltransferase / wax synthase
MRRLSSVDAAFVYAETDTWHMHVAALIIADPAEAPDHLRDDVLGRLEALIIERLPDVPQFRWRLVDTPLGVDHPHWVEDEHLDPADHIRRVTLPAPGGEAELDALVTAIVERQLDRSRPLWEMTLVDGLVDGRVALVTKVHHAIVDGVSAADILQVVLDLTPDPRPPSGSTRDDIGSAIDSAPSRFVRGITHRVTSAPGRAFGFVGQTARQAANAATAVVRRDRTAIPFEAPRTPLNGEFTARRELARLPIDLHRVLDVRSRFGVKVNDVVLALVAGSLRAYLGARDALPDRPLVVQCPVSLRTTSTQAEVGNQVGSLFVRLPTHLADALARLDAVASNTRAAKDFHDSMTPHQHVRLTELFAPAVIGLVARAYTGARLERAVSPINLIVSNVPGPPMPLYVAGAPLVALYPMGPLLLGSGLNITAFSHDGRLDIGVFACPDLIDEPSHIATGMELALRELEEIAQSRGRT